MPLSLDCPGSSCWRALLDAALPPEQQEDCERHLESCPACQERLRRAEEGDDVLLRLARQSGDPTAAPADPTLDRFLRRMRHAKGPQAKACREAPDLFFLDPTEEPALLGLLGPYEVREVIGQGGMGLVLAAYEPALHRLVAIKVLSPALAGSATARRRFTREAQAAAAVCHEHVVAVHGVHEADGLPYLVMQYVAGESLQTRLDRTGPLEVEEVVRIGMQTASGLAAAHAQGLIHRDIKPANLLLEDGLAKVKITDFGLARTADDVGLTRDGVVAGTPEYMAPEQARGEAVDHRADLFSLGSVLYACCTGRPPFGGPSAVAVLRKVSDESPPPVRSLNPGVPAWLEAFVTRLLAKDPGHRFPSAAEVAALLEGYLAHLRQPDSVPVPHLPSPPARGPVGKAGLPSQRRPVRNRWPAPGLWILAVLASSALGAVLWLLAGNGGTDQAAKGGEQPRKEQHVAFDFREAIDKLPPCSLFGPDLDAAVTTDAKGLRIARPQGRTNQITGVDVPIKLHSDFDIALGYELLAIGEPLPTYGAGVALRVMFGEPTSLTALIARSRKPAGDQFGTYKLLKEADGKDRYVQVLEMKATAPSGRLRLVRTGSQLQYLAADGVPGYRTLRSLEIGTEDVRLVRVYATTTDRPVLLDVRFTDLDVRADEIVRPAAEPAPPSAPAEAPRPGSGLTAALVFGLLLLTLGVALGVWLSARLRRAVGQPAPEDLPPDEPNAAPLPVDFSCAACGKKLRVKADLAGKKLKCPGCGEGVRVPGADLP
jgi:serine/threonine protein kinase